MAVGQSWSLPQSKRNRLLLLLGAVLLVILVGIALFFWMRPSASPAAPELAAPSNADSAIAAYVAAITLEPSRSENYRALSLAYRNAGRNEDAIAVWEKAVQANPGQTWPLLELGRAYELAGLPVKARDAFYRAASLDPQDVDANQALAQATERLINRQEIETFLAARLANAEPGAIGTQLHLLPTPLANGWTFLGVHGDLDTLAAGKPAVLWSFWQAPTPDVQPTLNTGSWQEVAPGLWAQLATATNLQPNGSFEKPLDGNSPQGFPLNLFDAPLSTRQMRRMQRGEELTTVAMLRNDDANLNTSLGGQAQAVTPDTVLLVAASVYADGGNPVVAWDWDSAAAEELPAPTQRATPAQATAGWQTVRGLAVPPAEAQSIHSLLLNTETSGAALFDDVVLAPLAAPAPLWPAASAAPAPAPKQTADRVAQFRTQVDRYLTYPPIVSDPAWQNGLARIGPLVSVGQTLSDGWTLLGYSTEEARLLRNEAAPLVLYWQGPEGAVGGALEDGWLGPVNGQWLQFLPAARTSLEDGTFESGLRSWAGTVFAAPVASRQLTVTAREGYTSTVAVLTNTPVFSSTSFAALPQPLAPGELYLQSGWARSEGGRGYIGHAWLGNLDPVLLPFDRYVAYGVEDDRWQHYAGVAEPLPGSEQVRVQLLNYLASGAAYFDDILFIPIGRPQPLVAANAPADSRALLAEYVANPTLVTDEGWLERLAAAGPAQLLDQAMDGDWSFVGYSTDEEALSAGAMAPVFYFWQGPLGSAPGNVQDGWYNIDAGLWVQIVRASNLLSSDAQLALPEPATLPPVTVDAQRLYLQAAQVRSASGNASIGVAWQAGDGTQTVFIANNVAAADWAHYAGLLTPPAGATAAQVLLADENNGENGDENGSKARRLLLLPVMPPALLTPAVGMRTILAF